jgi:hypothetical protein
MTSPSTMSCRSRRPGDRKRMFLRRPTRWTAMVRLKKTSPRGALPGQQGCAIPDWVHAHPDGGSIIDSAR